MSNASHSRSQIATSLPQTLARWLLGALLFGAGLAHLTVSRQTFRAQVPTWLPFDPDLVVLVSGVIEMLLGAALIFLPRYRVAVGWATAVFFILIFPGNIAQYTNGIDAFGLNTDLARFIRLLFQPVLVLWALWSTGALRRWE